MMAMWQNQWVLTSLHTEQEQKFCGQPFYILASAGGLYIAGVGVHPQVLKGDSKSKLLAS